MPANPDGFALDFLVDFSSYAASSEGLAKGGRGNQVWQMCSDRRCITDRLRRTTAV